MDEILAAWKALRAAEKRADEIVTAARLEFGRTMYEGRTLPPHLGRVSRKAIEKRIEGDEDALGYERLRQIEKAYADTLKVA